MIDSGSLAIKIPGVRNIWGAEPTKSGNALSCYIKVDGRAMAFVAVFDLQHSVNSKKINN